MKLLKTFSLSRLSFSVFLCGLFLFISCGNQPNTLESRTFDQACWSENDTLSTEIDFSASGETKNISFPVRVTDDFPYYNLFLKAIISGPGIQPGKGEFLLEYYVMDPTGNWLNQCEGTECDYVFDLSPTFSAPEKGKYKVQLFHYMRDSELCGVKQIGISVE